jgi:Tfp pilus assembly protein PilF
LQYEPNEPGVYSNLELIYARRSDWDAAIEHYRHAVHLVPHMAQGHNNLA